MQFQKFFICVLIIIYRPSNKSLTFKQPIPAPSLWAQCEWHSLLRKSAGTCGLKRVNCEHSCSSHKDPFLYVEVHSCESVRVSSGCHAMKTNDQFCPVHPKCSQGHWSHVHILQIIGDDRPLIRSRRLDRDVPRSDGARHLHRCQSSLTSNWMHESGLQPQEHQQTNGVDSALPMVSTHVSATAQLETRELIALDLQKLVVDPGAAVSRWSLSIGNSTAACLWHFDSFTCETWFKSL